MRLNLYLRGIDLIDVELHMGSKGLYVDLSVFKPREGEAAPEEGSVATTADLRATSSGSYELASNIEHPDTQVPGTWPVPTDTGFGFRGRQA